MLWESIPAELRARPQWVVWKYEEREGKPTKVPYRTDDGGKAETNNPATWGTYEQAAAAEGRFNGIGFVFSDQDDYVGIDLDHCRNPETAAVEPWAEAIIECLDSYTEVTPTGTGIHIICRGKLPAGRRRKGPVEVYEHGRYFTMTGECLAEHGQVAERAAELVAWHQAFFPPGEAASPANGGATTNGGGTKGVPMDWEIVDRVRALPWADNLWRGDFTQYSSQSEADMALLSRLAFFAGPDATALDRLFRQSGLYRQKWERSDYRAATIQEVLRGKNDFYAWVQEKKAPPSVVNSVSGAEGTTFPEGFTDTELLDKELEPERYAVPGYLGEGLTIFAGGQKKGKSYMAYAWAIAVAAGGRAFGQIQVEGGRVLYLALEDGPRRLKRRLREILQESQPTNRLHLYPRWPAAGQGGIPLLETWVKEHSDTRLVVIDTLGRFRGGGKQSGDVFQQDYEFGARLKRVADENQLSLVVVHHLSKRDCEDPFDQVSGTIAVTASADATLLLRRRRGQDHGTLFVTGRDIEEREMAVVWDKDTFSWTLAGTAEEFQMSHERREVRDYLRSNPHQTPQAIAAALEKNRGAVRIMLLRMLEAGELASENGVYWVPEPRLPGL